jgi:hypothetical protein
MRDNARRARRTALGATADRNSDVRRTSLDSLWLATRIDEEVLLERISDKGERLESKRISAPVRKDTLTTFALETDPERGPMLTGAKTSSCSWGIPSASRSNALNAHHRGRATSRSAPHEATKTTWSSAALRSVYPTRISACTTQWATRPGRHRPRSTWTEPGFAGCARAATAVQSDAYSQGFAFCSFCTFHLPCCVSFLKAPQAALSPSNFQRNHGIETSCSCGLGVGMWVAPTASQ